MDENWDSNLEEDERALAAAGGGGGTLGVETHGHLALGPVCVSLCLADHVWRVCGAVSCPLYLVLLLLSFLSFPLYYALLLSHGRGDEDAANEPIGTADWKRIK